VAALDRRCEQRSDVAFDFQFGEAVSAREPAIDDCDRQADIVRVAAA